MNTINPYGMTYINKPNGSNVWWSIAFQFCIEIGHSLNRHGNIPHTRRDAGNYSLHFSANMQQLSEGFWKYDENMRPGNVLLFHCNR